MAGKTPSKLPPAVADYRGSKTGQPLGVLGDRSIATAPAPAPTQGDLRSNYYTYLTKTPVSGQQSTEVLYNGDRAWVKLTLTLETAGPVAVGQQSAITPVLSGKGILLETGTPMVFTIGKGTRLYIAATALNRVKVAIEPLPWLEQIAATLNSLVSSLAALLPSGSTP